MNYQIESLAREYLNRGLSNGQALANAYWFKRAQPLFSPWQYGPTPEEAQQFAADVVSCMNVMRKDAAPVPDAEDSDA